MVRVPDPMGADRQDRPNSMATIKKTQNIGGEAQKKIDNKL